MNKLNWLVVGVGDITTRRVLPAIQAEPRSRLAGIVTRDPGKAERYQVPAWTDLTQALEESQAEAVYVATPVALHAPQSIAALQAGKHVLCEKPVALNYDQAAAIQKVSEETGKTFGVAYYRRFYPRVQEAKRQIEAGAIGRPLIADAYFHEWFYPKDGYRAWLIDPQMAGGGPLYDVASHRIDLMNFLLGNPTRATGQLSTLIQPTQVEDNATVLIEYESGARAIVDARWHAKVPRDEFRIRGTEGEINLTPLSAQPTHPNLHYPCIENFVSAVLDGAELISSGKTAIQTDWIVGQALVCPPDVGGSRGADHRCMWSARGKAEKGSEVEQGSKAAPGQNKVCPSTIADEQKPGR